MKQSIDPFSLKSLYKAPYDSLSTTQKRIQNLDKSYQTWRKTDLSTRLKAISKISNMLKTQKQDIATHITCEMGKPITQAIAELDKSISLCDYYVSHSKVLLKEAHKPNICYQPLGVILGIMPWNFPIWQVIRFAIPTLIMGNSVLIKPAPNVSLTSTLLKSCFSSLNAFDMATFDTNDTETIIANKTIKALSLTGSSKAGSLVASIASKYLKPCVLELGGNDPFIVCEDLSKNQVQHAAKIAIKARFQNTGQSCIATKRLLVHQTHLNLFRETFIDEMKTLTIGDPQNLDTQMGPLARADLLDTLQNQVNTSLQMGATMTYQAPAPKGLKGYFYLPTLLENITDTMPIFKEELFGPAIGLIPFRSNEEALMLANTSRYGLGASVWSKDQNTQKLFTQNLEVGSVFINDMVKSDISLPFGGIKESGYGRELGLAGLLSFSNLKTTITKELI